MWQITNSCERLRVIRDDGCLDSRHVNSGAGWSEQDGSAANGRRAYGCVGKRVTPDSSVPHGPKIIARVQNRIAERSEQGCIRELPDPEPSSLESSSDQ